MTSVVVVATVRPHPEERDAVMASFGAAIARVHAEDDGCELYALHDGGDHLVMIEKWTSRAALDAHARGGAVQELDAAVEGKLVVPTQVLVYTAVPAGSPAQGVL